MIVSEVAPPTPSAGLLTCDLTESSRFHVSRTCWWRHNWNTGTATELPLLLEAQARSLDPSRKLWPAVTGELVSACGAFEGPSAHRGNCPHRAGRRSRSSMTVSPVVPV